MKRINSGMVKLTWQSKIAPASSLKHGEGISCATNNEARGNDTICGILTEFCDNTTLHGLKYVGQKDQKSVVRLFWAIAFLLSTVTAAYFIKSVYNKWEDTPIIVSVAPQVTETVSIPFPAITLCYEPMLSKELAEELLGDKMENREHYKELVTEFCEHGMPQQPLNSSPQGVDAFSYFKEKTADYCNTIMEMCSYERRRHCEQFVYQSRTENGHCCTFNGVKPKFMYRDLMDDFYLNRTYGMPTEDWTPEIGYRPDAVKTSLPLRVPGVLLSGLSFVYNFYKTYCRQDHTKLMQIVVHSPVEPPMFGYDEHKLEFGKKYNFKLSSHVIMSAPSLQRVKPKYRQCYFTAEKYLRFFNTYTYTNCLYECEANITLKECGCLPWHMPRIAGARTCDLEDSCMLTKRSNLRSIWNKQEMEERCGCLPACCEVSYTTSEHYQPYSYPMETILSLSFSATSYISYYRSELLGLTEFLASTGGLLGLFLGFSFLSIVEVVYYIVSGLWRVTYKKKKIHLSS